MAIWKVPISLEMINRRNENTLVDWLGITFVDFTDDTITATMPVDRRTIQLLGLLHGGASAAMAETIGSVGANFCVDTEHHYCLGLDINTSHIRKAKEGTVKGIGRPIHIGSSTQVWEIRIYDEEERLVSQSRLTMIVISRNKG